MDVVDSQMDSTLPQQLAQQGFAFVGSQQMREALTQSGSLADWAAFVASWDDLHTDRYMADGGRYRRRRHAVYQVPAHGRIQRLPHRPHYQSRDYNALNGGVERWFEPVTEAVGDGASLTTILAACRQWFTGLMPEVSTWAVEVHQFRIEATAAQLGQPTPEGMHRDGVDHVLVLMIRRENIASGTTTIHDLQRQPLGSFTLREPFDAALVEDRHVYHGVTAVQALDPAQPAYRDVLVVTFRAEAGPAASA